jgi:hypothetical protein
MMVRFNPENVTFAGSAQRSFDDPRWLAVATDQDRQPPQRASKLLTALIT